MNKFEAFQSAMALLLKTEAIERSSDNVFRLSKRGWARALYQAQILDAANAGVKRSRKKT
jgi:hypothetical protein